MSPMHAHEIYQPLTLSTSSKLLRWVMGPFEEVEA